MKLSLAAYSMTSFVKEADIEGKLNHVSEGAKLCENSRELEAGRIVFSALLPKDATNVVLVCSAK